jgi:hypothetical protein
MPKASVVYEGSGIKESSKKTYLSRLKALNDGKEPSNYKFLQDTEVIEAKMDKYSTNSKRGFYIAIVAFLPEKNTARKHYYEQMMKINKDSKDNTEKSDKQKDNWMSQEEVRAVWEKLKEDAEPLLKKKQLSEAETNLLQSYVALSLYVLQPPRRSLDYTQMVVVPKYDDNMDKKFNYLSLKDKMFYFNNYKTEGAYKTQAVPIPEDLFSILKKYRKTGPLLVKNDKPMSVSQMTHLLNKVFGKKISVSMLRNIFLSSKYGDESKSLSEDAKAMGTSVDVAMNTYIKRD